MKQHDKLINLLPRLSFTVLLTLFVTAIAAQDVHFAQVQDMNSWYNPSLKTNKDMQLRVNLRNVNYQGMAAYTSGAATIDMPLINKLNKEEHAGFMNLTAGINYDKSNGSIMNVTTGMLAISYAQPLNNNHTFLSAGFQGTYTSSMISLNGGNLFPDQFDKYGPIGAATSGDPLQSGNTYGYFNVGAGLSVFHNSVSKQWYFGGSVRHLNQPYTENTHSSTFRLPMNYGLQGGYTASIKNEGSIGVYGIFTWQGGAYEHLVGALYTRNLDSSARTAFLIGLGYRIGDALIPDIGLKFGRNKVALNYEINISSIESSHYSRTGFELSYMFNF
jgi:type IX secretion system PorP/SprF family membrane protein